MTNQPKQWLKGDIIWGICPQLDSLPYEWQTPKPHPHLILETYEDGTYLLCPISTSLPKWLKQIKPDSGSSLKQWCGPCLHSCYKSKISDKIKLGGELDDDDWNEIWDIIELSETKSGKYKMPKTIESKNIIPLYG